jgi:hypothetical protein
MEKTKVVKFFIAFLITHHSSLVTRYSLLAALS